jgi:hypothetical protein
MTDVSGKPVDWAPGRVTVLTFCAYWCDTWRQQVPRLLAAKRATAGLPVDFTTISVDGRWSEVSAGNHGLPLWLDRGGEFSHSKSVDRVPTTVVLDAAGEVRFVSGAVIRTDDIVQAVHEALTAKANAGTIYLTFEDFPPKEGGEELLDTLRSLGVKATFACPVAHTSDKLAIRAVREGHTLQSTPWDWSAGPHHRIVDPYDYTRPTKKELLRRILPQACPEAVIRLHAGVAVTLDCLPELVAALSKRGFKFDALRL